MIVELFKLFYFISIIFSFIVNNYSILLEHNTYVAINKL